MGCLIDSMQEGDPMIYEKAAYVALTLLMLFGRAYGRSPDDEG